MKTFLKALLAILILAMIWGYAHQQGRIGSPNSGLGSLFSSQPKTIEILSDRADGQPAEDQESINCLLPETGTSCKTPRWDSIIHGEPVISYLVNGEWACQSTVSVCNNWAYLAWAEPYGLKSCPGWLPGTWDAYLGCQFGDLLIPAGQTITLYGTAEQDWSSRSCDSQARTCTDGSLNGDSEYSQLNCYSPASEFCQEPEEVVDAEVPTETIVKTIPIKQPATSQPTGSREPNCPSPFGGKTWFPGQEGSVYASSTVWFGQICTPTSIVCSYGSIRYGTKTNPGNIAVGSLATSCEVLDPVGCTSSCGDVSHGDDVTTYSTSIIPHGNGQTCDDVVVNSTCSNGALSPSDGGSCTCQIAPPAGCVAPGGQRVGHENSLTLYQYPQVIAVPGDGSDTCVRQWRQCVNGSFYDWNGNRADFTYQYDTCEVVAPPAGWGPGGDGIPTT